MKRKAMIIGILVLVLAIAAGVVGAQEGRPGDRGGRGGPGPRGLAGDMMDVVTEATGLEADAIREALREGQSLADVITANGGDVQAVIDDLVAQASERLSTAVEEGRLTQEEADERLANLEAHITAMVNGEAGFGLRGERGFGLLDERGFGLREGVRGLAGDMMDVVTEATGLEADAIREALREGQSLADVITANGGDVQAVIDDLVAQASERLSTAVEEGRLTQEEADERLADLEAHITAMVNGEAGFGLRGAGGFGPRGRGGR